ncbi:DUF4124 domain-containing protein [Trichlorobacter sp.]|uniref:DUF4124 domain-containing protein n=1 Tax=Trichlorobacter sp. TaxID=2911007 RepID=UPI002A36A065|nr:DUF4124 domain-containing protein [Trichlorobacter sp.]MDY0384562.1 DUF4124 domain-containing protein [Trichlorobacter sp.]
MKRLVLVMLLALPLQVSAEIYSWTDAAGTVHFTEDLGSVPKNYRAKALRQASGEDVTVPAAVPEASSPDGSTKAERTQSEVSQDTAAPAPGITSATRFGSRSAAEWQAEFRSLRQKLAQIEQQQEQLRKEGGDGTKALSRQQIEEINARNKQFYDEYEATRLRFNQLVEQANQVGLPPEFAQ